MRRPQFGKTIFGVLVNPSSTRRWSSLSWSLETRKSQLQGQRHQWAPVGTPALADRGGGLRGHLARADKLEWRRNSCAWARATNSPAAVAKRGCNSSTRRQQAPCTAQTFEPALLRITMTARSRSDGRGSPGEVRPRGLGRALSSCGEFRQRALENSCFAASPVPASHRPFYMARRRTPAWELPRASIHFASATMTGVTRRKLIESE